MGWLEETVYLNEMAGQARQTIYLKPMAYRENGSLLTVQQDWEDSGLVDRPNQVVHAPLWVTAGNDGMRRIHPTRELDRYIELGAPFVKTGGVWGQVNLGLPQRNGNRLVWTRPQANMYVDFGGHFLKLAILLKNGYVPEDNQIAFPVGMEGFTRQGSMLLRDGIAVARLDPPVMIDYANPVDVRPITHQITLLNGQAYWLMTLPNLTGMAQPLIDPTVSLQPDETTSIDTYINKSSAAGNFGSSASLISGGNSASAQPIRGLVQFDLSSIPAGATINSAILTLYCAGEASSTDLLQYAHRSLVQWYEGDANNGTPSGDGSTWNLRNSNGSVAWAGGAGGVSGTEWAATATNSVSITGIGYFDIDLTVDVQTFVNGTYTNYGWWLILQNESTSNTRKVYTSSSGATAGNRPKLVVDYTVAASGSTLQRVERGVMRGVMRGAR